ncbi:GATA zinc finger domain-containing protein 14-like [Salvia hispanica]|uniref:GATA zinc finger domain-containing protein 14-like n=1 Tax=Salvia hispanica TaxID=49212 RepID=UPI002009A918|nr:GATA zinc finger domain-containing protein 14-like [Salvia hispanica]
MADQGEDDPELTTLTAHADGDPPQAIVVTPSQTACDVKPHVIAILPTYCGKSYEGPYEFLNEFCKICKAQRRPAGASEDDYRLKPLPFVLKGEANTWFMRLPADSINTLADFKSVFLAEFFPSSKTSALKRNISCITQEYDETLSEYWEKYMSLLESCPNHRMKEIEVHHTFYEGMNKETKDLANSSSGGDFTQLGVSEAKKVLRKLLNAKKTYGRERVARYYNSNGNWIPGKQRDAPWRDHQNFRWGDGNQNQNQNQAQNQPNPHPNQNPNRGPTNPDYQSNWVGRNQQPQNQNSQNQNPNPTYVPPHQRNNQNQNQNQNQNHNQNQLNPGPQHNTHHQNQSQYQHNHDQYNPPAQYNQYPPNQNQQNFSGYQSNPPPQYNQHQSSNQFHQPNRSRRSMEDMMGEMLASQQSIKNDLQSSNETMQGMQSAQKEHRANMDMMNRQLAQLANSVGEMKGNSGKLPSTVHVPEKTNVSKITLRSGTAYNGPQLKNPVAESSRERVLGDTISAEELKRPLPQMEDPFFLNEKPPVERKEGET